MRESIPVPAPPMEAIRRRSHTATTHARVRALAACGAIVLVALAAGTGFGQTIYDGVRVWLGDGKAAVSVRSLVIVHEPTAMDLRSVIARATFPVVLPVGIPAGTRVDKLFYAPADRPNFLAIEYRNEPASLRIVPVLFDSTAIEESGALSAIGSAGPAVDVQEWRLAKETIVVPQGHLSPSELNQIKAATLNASPPASLVTTEAMLPKIVALAGSPALVDVAQRLAPPGGRTVLLDPASPRSISSRSLTNLVDRNAPILDSRTAYLSNIPYVNGEPDYLAATVHFPRIVAVSPGGVRAIAAVLRTTGGVNCGCEILFNQPNAATYWIWKIPLSGSLGAKKYSVDATTSAVTPSL